MDWSLDPYSIKREEEIIPRETVSVGISNVKDQKIYLIAYTVNGTTKSTTSLRNISPSAARHLAKLLNNTADEYEKNTPV